MVLERDDEGILEEETEFFRQRFLQQGQWRVNYLNEPWQLAKRLLIQQDLWPNKFCAHPQLLPTLFHQISSCCTNEVI